jgi:hypothetical protein
MNWIGLYFAYFVICFVAALLLNFQGYGMVYLLPLSLLVSTVLFVCHVLLHVILPKTKEQKK